MVIADIFQETRDLVDATSVSYPDVTLLRRANTAYEDIVGDILNADGTWWFDDSRYGTLPIGVCNLIDGQSQYSFSTTFLEVEDVKVQNAGGLWFIMKPWNQEESDVPMETYQINPAFPWMYTKVADTWIMHTISVPSVGQTRLAPPVID